LQVLEEVENGDGEADLEEQGLSGLVD
jgi:hypothetical protein